MQQYLSLINKLLNDGAYKKDRTNIGCYSIFGYQMKFNLEEKFPLVTTKKNVF